MKILEDYEEIGGKDLKLTFLKSRQISSSRLGSNPDLRSFLFL